MEFRLTFIAVFAILILIFFFKGNERQFVLQHQQRLEQIDKFERETDKSFMKDEPSYCDQDAGKFNYYAPPIEDAATHL